MFSALKEKATSFSDKAKETIGTVSNDASDTLTSIKLKGTNGYQLGKSKAQKAAESTRDSIKSNIAEKDYLTIVQDFVQKNAAQLRLEIENTVGEYSQNKFRNPATKALIAMAIYALFPAPIQWTISEEDFNEFFMDNSEVIFSKLGFVD